MLTNHKDLRVLVDSLYAVKHLALIAVHGGKLKNIGRFVRRSKSRRGPCVPGPVKIVGKRWPSSCDG